MAAKDPSSYYDTWKSAIGLNDKFKAFSTFNEIISYFLPFVLTIAGIALFGMIAAGGFTMLAGAADKEAQTKGKQMISNGAMGFIILFLSYWLAQILQVIFKFSIVSG